MHWCTDLRNGRTEIMDTIPGAIKPLAENLVVSRTCQRHSKRKRYSEMIKAVLRGTPRTWKEKVSERWAVSLQLLETPEEE